MKRYCLTVPEIEERLKSAGILATAQRISICRYVLCEAEHPTAEDVKRWVDQNFPKMSLATVYNTLGALVQAGLLKEVRLPNRDRVVYDQNTEAHHHFIDEATGTVTDVDAKHVRISSELGKLYQVNQVDVILRGTRPRRA